MTMPDEMRVEIFTKEYPPEVYGGAGVHVAELAKALRGHVDLHVRCFGQPRQEAAVTAYDDPADLAGQNAALQTLGVDLRMAGDAGREGGVDGVDLVHSHTWYANFAGHVAGLLHQVPHVVTAHSLEPLRPWKAEQLGGGYALSSFAERTAYQGAAAVIAVSDGMRRDILRCYPELDPDKVHVVHNGIDSDQWHPDDGTNHMAALGVEPERPSVVFVGRITRQKGLPYLLRAAASLPEDVQLVLCAGAPDTPEIMAEVTGLVEQLQATRSGVVWIDRVVPRDQLRQLLTHATVFVCPSVYEPLGIVNLEAMACGAPVVGTATGGIPEVVVDGETGWLVPIEQLQDGTGTPVDPDRFVADLAATLVDAVSDPARARRLGENGRRRAVEHFSWDAVADRTVDVYRAALGAFAG
jgi:starch synthase